MWPDVEEEPDISTWWLADSTMLHSPIPHAHKKVHPRPAGPAVLL